MLVSLNNINEVVAKIHASPYAAIDCETTSLRPFHGGRLFSFAIAIPGESFYFNFQKYEGLSEEFVLGREFIPAIFSKLPKIITNLNLKFDLHFLMNEGVSFEEIEKRETHCSMVTERIVRNDRVKLSLEALAPLVFEKKDTSVDEYIEDNDLYEVNTILKNKKVTKNKQFSKVPFEIISKYAIKDAIIALKLYERQVGILAAWDITTKKVKIIPLYDNECDLLKTTLAMERNGIGIDYDFILKAIEVETVESEKILKEIKSICGNEFKDSNKFLSEYFKDHKTAMTEKGRKSFAEGSLKEINHPVAPLIDKLRYHLKRKNTYFENFKYFATTKNRLHPQINQHQAVTGRISITNPALQTLSKEEDEADLKSVSPIRRAFVPLPGNCLVELDYKAMQYLLMLEYGKELPMIENIKKGIDPHLDTSQKMGIGTRDDAKTMGFRIFFGGGIPAVASALNITYEKAKILRAKFLDALPGVKNFIKVASDRAKERGYVFNFFGRRFFFQDPSKAYKAANAIVQGSEADTCKIALVRMHAFLRSYKTKIVLQIHDAILLDMPPQEFSLLDDLIQIAEQAYPYKYIKLSVSVKHSWESWDSLEDGPPGKETRNVIHGQSDKVLKDIREVLLSKNSGASEARGS